MLTFSPFYFRLFSLQAFEEPTRPLGSRFWESGHGGQCYGPGVVDGFGRVSRGEGGVWAQVHDVDGGYRHNLFHSMLALKLYVIHRVLVVRKRVLFRRKYIPLHRS